jgi:hypothetical protein
LYSQDLNELRRLLRDGAVYRISKNNKGESISLSISGGHTWVFDEHFKWDRRETAYTKAVNSFK